MSIISCTILFYNKKHLSFKTLKAGIFAFYKIFLRFVLRIFSLNQENSHLIVKF